MASTSETGHAKNVANFEDLIAFVTGYGANYSPTKSSLKLSELNDLLTMSQIKLADVVTKNTSFNNAVNDRLSAFAGIRPLATRLVSALDATDATSEKMKDAEGFNRKLQGKRASSAETPSDPTSPPPSTISVSQQSYDQKIEHFAGLISVLESESSYSPNEGDLQVGTLNSKKAEMVSKNSAVSTAYTNISNSRIDRDKTLYNPDTGLVDIAGEVKKYVKSVFGASSPEYGQIKGIAFKKAKK